MTKHKFAAIKGAIAAAATLMATGALADQVILDDLIVDGSACIGFDCVNGESFGFDTLRLKENNLRIKAFDTSSSASFPTQDWQLTFNDTANGGQNKFAVECVSPGSSTPFTVEGCAPSHSLYVDDGGRVGLGTNSPVVELHIKDGDTPTLRLEQDGSSGFTPQTWDVAGNEANFFVRDVTNGSKLPFKIKPGAPTSSIFIQNNGRVGIGTESPSQQLAVVAGGPVGIDLNNTTQAEIWRFRAGNSGNLVISDAAASGTDEMVLAPNGDLTILGALTTSGATCNVTPCDGVFLPEFEVPSIDEHASYMWQNSHLKAVGPTRADAPLNLSQKTTGILHELEVAHIYIEQLHERISQMEARFADLESNTQ